MKLVHRCESPLDAAHWKNLLEQRGIACDLRRIHLGSVVGEIPWPETWPELWVLDDRDAEIARRIIRNGFDHSLAGRKPWVCAHCGEHLEPQFTTCWKCGRDEPVQS